MIVIVVTTRERKDGRPGKPTFPFETIAYDTIAAMDAALEAGKSVAGNALVYRRLPPDGDGERHAEILRRSPKVFTREERQAIEEPRFKFFEIA